MGKPNCIDRTGEKEVILVEDSHIAPTSTVTTSPGFEESFFDGGLISQFGIHNRTPLIDEVKDTARSLIAWCKARRLECGEQGRRLAELKHWSVENARR